MVAKSRSSTSTHARQLSANSATPNFNTAPLQSPMPFTRAQFHHMKRMASPHGFDLSSEIIGSVTSTSPRQPRPSPLPPFANINLSTLNMYAYEYLNASGLDAWRQLCDEIRTSYLRPDCSSSRCNEELAHVQLSPLFLQEVRDVLERLTHDSAYTTFWSEAAAAPPDPPHAHRVAEG